VPRLIRIALYAVTAIVLGAVIGATAPAALRRLGAVAALQPGMLPWYSVRALGFLAYLTVAGSVVYGLLLTTRILDAIANRPVSFTLHKELSIAGLVLGVLHAAILTADRSFDFTPRAILVPFASPYAPLWVGLGQLTMYGLAVVTASFYARRRIGQRTWRLVHYLTFLLFIGATAHGVLAGSDSGARWATAIYMSAGAAVFFLLVYRIVLSVLARLPSSTGPNRAAPPARPS
jgi:predicted ferric reductase